MVKAGSQYDVRSCVASWRKRIRKDRFLVYPCVALQHVYNRTALCNATQRKTLCHIVNQPKSKSLIPLKLINGAFLQKTPFNFLSHEATGTFGRTPYCLCTRIRVSDKHTGQLPQLSLCMCQGLINSQYGLARLPWASIQYWVAELLRYVKAASC